MSIYEAREAAVSLATGLSELTRLQEQAGRYDYEIPPRLMDGILAESVKIRDAVRVLVSTDADDDPAVSEGSL